MTYNASSSYASHPHGLQAKCGMKNGKVTDFCVSGYSVIPLTLSAGYRSRDKH